MHLRVQSWFPFQVTVCLNALTVLASLPELAQIGDVATIPNSH
jgi:hypothetical protein